MVLNIDDMNEVFECIETIKFEGPSACQYLLNEKNGIVIHFCFDHSGLAYCNDSKRLEIGIIRLENYAGPLSPLPIVEVCKLAVNQVSDRNHMSDGYEMMFLLEILTDTKQVRVTLVEEPNHGRQLITDAERVGITRSF